MQSRETWVQIEYEDKDITTELQPYIISFTYNDNSKNEIDDIEMTLENGDGRWFNEWFPDEGAKLIISLIKKRWEEGLVEETMPCGSFYIDQIDMTPGVISLKALAIPIGNLKNQVNSVAWEKISLKDIAADIANKHSITLEYYVEEEIMFQRVDQDKETDLIFLNRICQEEGVALKATDAKIVIYDIKKFEEEEKVLELSRIEDFAMIKDYSFSRTNKGIYDKVEVSYYDPGTKKLIREVLTEEQLEKRKEEEKPKKEKSTASKREQKKENKKKSEKKQDKNGKTLKVNGKAKGTDNKKKAQKALEKENKEKETVNMTVVGNFLLAGQNINLKDFGYFDGKYSIEKAVHTLDSGYTTALELKKVKTE